MTKKNPPSRSVKKRAKIHDPFHTTRQDKKEARPGCVPSRGQTDRCQINRTTDPGSSDPSCKASCGPYRCQTGARQENRPRSWGPCMTIQTD